MNSIDFQDKLQQAEELFVQGQVQESLEAFIHLKEQFPENPEVLNNLGVACYSLNRLEQAKDYLSQATSLNPEFQEAQDNLNAISSSLKAQQPPKQNNLDDSSNTNEYISGTHFPIKTKDQLTICTPETLECMTSFVLLEQEDWFEPEIEFVRSFLEPGMIVLDIGACFGVYALPMAKLVGPEGKVFAFEPSHQAREHLGKSREINQFDNLEIISYGLSDQPGQAKLYLNDTPERNSLSESKNQQTQDIELSTLDTWWHEAGQPHLDLIKIDVTGHEAQVLQGSTECLNHLSPILLITFTPNQGVNSQILQTLQLYGYEQHRYLPGPGAIAPEQISAQPDPYLCNIVAVKKDKAEELAQNNLLVTETTPPAPEDNAWEKYLADLPWTESFCTTWQQHAGQEQNQDFIQALNRLFTAQLKETPTQDKYSHTLQAAQQLMQLFNSPQASGPVALCLARAFADLGLRGRSAHVLEQLLSAIDKGQCITFNTPFLPPIPDMDQFAVNISPQQWIMARTMEGLIATKGLSGYFQTNALASLRSALLQNKEHSSAFAKRHMLIAKMQGQQYDSNSLESLQTKDDNTANAWFWTRESFQDQTQSLSMPSSHAEQQSAAHTYKNKNSTWAVIIKGNIQVFVPNDISNFTTYVLLEQEDWCEPEIDFVRELIEPEMTALDLDTGYGVYALTMANEMGGKGRVIALNASEHFSQSAQENGLQDLITTELDDSSLDFISLGETQLDQDLLTRGSPLIMFPPRKDLIKNIINQGLDLYRYVPGLNALVPHDGEQTANLFACNRERAGKLSNIELLVQEEPASEVQPQHTWEALGNLSYSETLLSLWRSNSLDPDYEQAINCYISSWDDSLPLAERYALLKQSLEKLSSLQEDHAVYTITHMRVLSDLGLRRKAASQAGQLLKDIGQSKTLKMNRPFVPPIAEFDQRPVKEDLSKWLSAAIMYTFEKQRAYSSHHNPKQHLPVLSQANKLPDSPVEIQIRLALCAMRLGKNVNIQTGSRFLTDEHFNTGLWRKLTGMEQSSNSTLDSELNQTQNDKMSFSNSRQKQATNETQAWIKTVQSMLTANVPLFKKDHNLQNKLIISLTSYPKRFPILPLTLRSLLAQTIKTDRIIIWIAHEDRPQITHEIKEFTKAGIDIWFCEDIKSYKKIIPTLEKFRDSYIVTADDDIYYPPTWLEELVESWKKHKKDVIAHRVHQIKLDEQGNPLPYRKWKWQYSDSNQPSPLNFQTGVEGVLYPPNCFHQDVLRKDIFQKLCPSADDIWLYWMLRLNDKIVRPTGERHKLISWPGSQREALWKNNMYKSGNDEQIKAMIKEYGIPINDINLKTKTKYYNKSKSELRKLIITGIPRSGTSLFSKLINDLPNTICLNEILYDVDLLPSNMELIRNKVLRGEPIPNKYKSDEITTDTQEGINQVKCKSIDKYVDNNLVIGSKVNIPYLNQINKIINYNYPIIAIIRNPIFTIASWNSKKAAHIPEAQVTDNNMNPRWTHFNFYSNNKIIRQAQIWQYYASIIYSIKDKIIIIRYEDFTQSQESLNKVLRDVCKKLNLQFQKNDIKIQNQNSKERFTNIEEIQKVVREHCSIATKFGYTQNYNYYNPITYWNNRQNPNNPFGNKKEKIYFDVNYIKQNLDESKIIFELGPGIGRTFSAYTPGTTIHSLDISTNYQTQLYRNAKKKELFLKQFFLKDMNHQFPFDNNSFNIGVTSQVLLHIPPRFITHFMQELSRICKKIIVITRDSNHHNRQQSLLSKHVFNHNYEQICSTIGCTISNFNKKYGCLYFTYHKH